MNLRYFLKPALAAVALLAAFFLFSYAKKSLMPEVLGKSTCKEETKKAEEGAIKGDLFFWESITRNLASIH